MKHIDFYTDLVINGQKQSGGSGTGGITPSGTKQINITQNGTSEHDVTQYAKASVTVDVPASGITPTGTKTITENGTHDVTNFAQASVQVPIPPEPTGEKVIEITTNGTKTEDIKAFATAKINVNVPATGITPTGTKEVSVVANGEKTEDVREFESVHIVTSVPEPSGTKQITTNGTHDVKAFASVNVSVPTGGGSDEKYKALLDRSITDFSDEAVTKVGRGAFYGAEKLKTIDLPNCTEVQPDAFFDCKGLERVSIPNVTKLGKNAFRIYHETLKVDNFLKEIHLQKVTELTGNTFSGRTELQVIKCNSVRGIGADRYDSVLPASSSESKLHTVDILGGNGGTLCVDASNGSNIDFVFRSEDGVTRCDYYTKFPMSFSIYVPDSLVEQYKVATNWSKYADKIKPLSTYVAKPVV